MEGRVTLIVMGGRATMRRDMVWGFSNQEWIILFAILTQVIIAGTLHKRYYYIRINNPSLWGIESDQTGGINNPFRHLQPIPTFLI